MTRAAAGRTAVSAVRITSPLRVDGRLDEEIYPTTRSVSGLIQIEQALNMGPLLSSNRVQLAVQSMY